MLDDDMVVSGILPSMADSRPKVSYISPASGGAADPDSDSDFLDCELSGCEEADASDAEGGGLIVEKPPIEYNALVADVLAYLNNVRGI